MDVTASIQSFDSLRKDPISFAPLYQSGLIVTAHAFAALTALVFGAAQLMLAKGTTGHRIIGYIWVSLLGAVALSSFWIHDIRQFGPFSFLHGLSVYTLFGLVSGIRDAQRGKIDEHRKTMRQIFFVALIGAGAFTLLPGRSLHLVLFGS